MSDLLAVARIDQGVIERAKAAQTTSEQRMEALGRANAVRTTRAGAKQVWKEMGALRAARELIGLLEGPPYWAATWRVEAALLSLPRLGPVRVRAEMQRIGISSSKTLSGLTARQRDELISWLDERS